MAKLLIHMKPLSLTNTHTYTQDAQPLLLEMKDMGREYKQNLFHG